VVQPFTLELPDGVAWVIDPPVDPYGDGYVCRARVEIRADGLTAHTIATIDTSPLTLPGFFAQMDADWRGWDGERRWRALEGELMIEARHDGGQILMAVTVRHSWWGEARSGRRDEWSARVEFTLEPGEQLRNVARELAFLFAA
jgi:hypothetical protein